MSLPHECLSQVSRLCSFLCCLADREKWDMLEDIPPGGTSALPSGWCGSTFRKKKEGTPRRRGPISAAACQDEDAQRIGWSRPCLVARSNSHAHRRRRFAPEAWDDTAAIPPFETKGDAEREIGAAAPFDLLEAMLCRRRLLRRSRTFLLFEN